MESRVPKIACFSSRNYEIQHFKDSLARLTKEEFVEIKYFTESLNAKIAEELLPKDYYTTVCIFVNDQLNAECLTVLKEKGVFLIALRCAGYNNVDLKKAKELGIRTVRVPAYSPQAVAEMAISLLCTFNRKIHKSYARTKEYNFTLEGLIGCDLYKKTIGIIGVGRIGKALMSIAHGFGMKILGYDIYKPEEDLK